MASGDLGTGSPSDVMPDLDACHLFSEVGLARAPLKAVEIRKKWRPGTIGRESAEFPVSHGY
jgi:hypothetical protein